MSGPTDITEVAIPGGLANRPLPVRNGAHPPETPPKLFRLHTLAAFIGPRGCGKTNACVVLAREYLRFGSFNRVFLISPTYGSNTIFDELHIQPGDVYEDMHACQDALRDILRKIEEDRAAYDAMQEYGKLWRKFKRHPQKCTPAEMAILEDVHYMEPFHIPFPSPLVIVDDMSHSDLYGVGRSNPLINLALRHRHIFDGTGCTIFFLLQNFRSHGSIPKPVRENIQQWFIWNVRDQDVLRTIHSEFASLLSFDEFHELFRKATADSEHEFLTIDLNPIDKVLQFRKNFDVVLVPPSRAVPPPPLSTDSVPT